MVRIKQYTDKVEAIYLEQPKYETGHDGSDGFCDCIGMCRGALKRAGVTNITNFRGTNQAARKTIQNLQKFTNETELMVGDVVLKVRDKDDPNMPLPDKYRKGGSEYDPTWGETNFTHIGTVTSTKPLMITHMTSPSAKKDKTTKGWTYVGQLPWVDYSDQPDPGPDPGPEPQPALTATVYADNGKPVKMRAKPSASCKLYWEVPCGSIVDVIEIGDEWSHIKWNGITGYMMTRFLQMDGAILWTVCVPHLTRDQAEAMISRYPGAWMTAEGGGEVG